MAQTNQNDLNKGENYLAFICIICILSTRYSTLYVREIVACAAEGADKILRMQAATNVILRDIKQQLARLHDAIINRNLDVAQIDDNLISPFLLFGTICIIQEFDAFLKASDEATKQFVSLHIFFVNNCIF